ncbi:MAG: acyl-CoA dehydrogenase family protein [Pseudomonadota bacterium]
MDLQQFRTETRAWLAANCPPGARGPGYVPIGSRSIALDSDTRLWLDRMVEKGWTVPSWPVEYGGAELSKDEYRILIEELHRIEARPPLSGRCVNYIGPTILEYGDEDQKAKWLPICARGEGAWAMGYSEPGAGSDLASLSTKAERNGDHWLINGSKIWTSDAMDCDYIFVLCRTSPSRPKHQGISMLLVDMHQPGVRVSPITLISGKSTFCETYFENAIVPIDDVVGGVDNGWTVGKRLLQFERSTHAGINTSGSQGGRVEGNNVRELVQSKVGWSDGPLADAQLRDRLLAFEMNSAAQRLTQERAVAESKTKAPGYASSVVKLTNALNIKEGDELVISALGSEGLNWDDSASQMASTRNWLTRKQLTIAGGTQEVQLNIIAKRVLGLPD